MEIAKAAYNFKVGLYYQCLLISNSLILFVTD